MSLKAFHIVFIGISILLAIGYGIWEFNNFATSGEGVPLLLGICAIVAAAGLIIYAVRFMRKLKHVRMI